MAVVGSHFSFSRRFGSSFLCAGSWPFCAGLILCSICHFSLLVVFPCSAFWCLITCWLFLSLVCSVFSGRRWISLQVSLFFVHPCFMTYSWPFFPVYFLRLVKHALSGWVLSVCCYQPLVLTLFCLGVDGMISGCFVLGCLPALLFFWMFFYSAPAGKFLIFLLRRVNLSMYAWGLYMWCFQPSAWSLYCLGVYGVKLECFVLGVSSGIAILLYL